MSYLLDLINSLNEIELKNLSSLDFVGKEELVRNTYVSRFRSTGFNESSLLKELNISKSHFDKINSVLLNKALLFFGGTDLNVRLDFFVRKQLNDLMLHELKLNEKRLKKVKDKVALRELYKEAFRVTLLSNFNNFAVDEVEYYRKAYTQFLDENEEEERYRVLAKEAEVLMRYYYPRKDGAAKREVLLKKLLVWQKEIENKEFFIAETAVNLALSSYYETSNPEKGLEYLLQADAAARKNYDKISERDKAFILAMTATSLIDLSRYEEAIVKYEELFSKFAPLASARVFHPFQYVFGLLILEKFYDAEVVMKKYLDPFLHNENARNFHFDILRIYAIYHLLNHQTKEAGNCLQQLLQFGKEDFTPLGDVLFRLVHNVYCIQTGDYVLAADVLKKNIKFIDSKLEIEGMDAYKKMFHDLGKVIRFKNQNSSIDKKTLMQQMDMGLGRTRLYMQLITLPLQ